MHILVFEPNLFWSARLMKTLAALGHQATLIGRPAASYPSGQVAIVNLGASEWIATELIPKLREAGIYVIGHAGHKETELRELGRAAGCDRIASNSEMTFKIESLLAEAG